MEKYRFFAKVIAPYADTMTGGTFMYIHGYQIHNVLNVYRKQLSHGPVANNNQNVRRSGTKDHVKIASDGQRQSLIDKISTEIVERISQNGPENQFGNTLANQLIHKSQQTAGLPANTVSDFKYTVIDENNHKITNSLTIRGLNVNSKDPDAKTEKEIDNNQNSKAEEKT
jgi:hypothetical protein